MMFTTFVYCPETIIGGGSGSGPLSGASGNDAISGDGRNHQPPEDASYLIAAYACYSVVMDRFDCKNRHCKAQKQQYERRMGRSSAKTSYASPVRLAGQKGLGRRMDSAQTASNAK